jgi:hypothetical protein
MRDNKNIYLWAKHVVEPKLVSKQNIGDVVSSKPKK